MDCLLKYPILAFLLKPFRLSQQKTCASIVAALCQSAQASSFAIAGQLSCLTEVGFGSALNRVYRFLRNDRFDNWLLTKQLLILLERDGTVLLALDWTKWQDKFSVLTACVCVDKRSIPIAVSACIKQALARSQNLWEETFLRLCVQALDQAAVKAIWLCDRGFHRVAWLARLLDLKQKFVVRLQKDVSVHTKQGAQILKNIKIKPGKVIDLGWVDLRSDKAVRVRVIGIWSKQSKEVWWLATNLNQSIAEIVGYYDRRMGIEEQFRDGKGARFGMKLKWTQYKKPEYIERMYMLLAIAMILWTSVGRAVEKQQEQVRIECKSKGQRLSLMRVGIYYWQKVTSKVRISVRYVRDNLPPPCIRIFQWLCRPQN
jgi:hypothetical protein